MTLNCYFSVSTLDCRPSFLRCRARVGLLLQRILGKQVKARIVKRVYQTQQQLPCEGCQEHWGNQDEHACLFFGNGPEYRVEDFVSDHYEHVVSTIDTNEVIEVFDAVCRILFGADATQAGLTKETLKDITQDILLGWQNETEDITQTFNSFRFPNVTTCVRAREKTP